ncbi:cytosolic protein [Virgibacillus profundi]|uniref:Cytosolic protein n=1 Tax=Virgibacillus profundi TaxID=2024555 RepID=A0A2A2IEG5_9BACI|nr:cytosolic protein [Virgibacillus profundi]PAV30411.1 cytosolic protein [Virgibacillus profundi]PXY54583.1 cytosolic protein [Virgibacillus profundi]
MSLRNTISKYFNNHSESKEEHWDPSLQTHYYKTTKDKGMQMLENFFKSSQAYDINSISKEHGEISVNVKKGKKAFIVATVIMVRPYQTAIDFSVTTESVLPFDFGYSFKLIQKLYTQINKELQLIEKTKTHR